MSQDTAQTYSFAHTHLHFALQINLAYHQLYWASYVGIFMGQTFIVH